MRINLQGEITSQCSLQVEEDILKDLDLILGSVIVFLYGHKQDILSGSYSIFLLSIHLPLQLYYELYKKEMLYSVLHKEEEILRKIM